LLSLSYFYQEKYDDALYYVNIALQMKPNDLRMLKNKELIENNLSK